MSVERRVVRALALLLAANGLMGAPVNAARGAADDREIAVIKQKRKQAANRKRRIIFDNDGNEPVYYLKKADADEFLKCRTYGVVGSQVDTIVYCTWSSGFSYFTHNTKVGKVFTCTAEKFNTNKTKDFIAQGTDPLKIIVDFCRRKGIEIFWSMRMNDTHDAWGGWYSPYLFPPIKKEHPEWLVGRKDKRPPNGAWSAVDYGVDEIRDLAYRFIEEVCENYDVDGVMLDFLRHPLYFRCHAWGKPCGQQEWDQMTGLIRRVRTMADRVGAKRGRPILVATRTPDSVGYAKAMGLDVERWMKDGLIDILVVSGYFRLSPWETTVELGHRYGVKVYPCLSETRIADGQAKKIRGSLASYRARAMTVHDAGADGVYLFNYFNPNSKLWHQLGDPKTMAGLDKVYTTGARGVRVIDRWMRGARQKFLRRAPLSPETPRKLEPNKPVTIELRVGENLSETTRPPTPATVTLRLRFKGLTTADEITVKLNGQAISGGRKSDVWVDYVLDPSLVKRGPNAFEITLAADSKSKAVLEDLIVQIAYKKRT